MPGSSTTLLTRRGSTPTRFGGSHLSPRKGSGPIMSLGSRRTRGVPRVRTNLESETTLVSICLLVPLPKGNTMKEAIRLIGFGLVGG
jgi:hypothetical protein